MLNGDELRGETLTIFWSSTSNNEKKSEGSARYLRKPRRNARRTDIFCAWMKLSRIVAATMQANEEQHTTVHLPS